MIPKRSFGARLKLITKPWSWRATTPASSARWRSTSTLMARSSPSKPKRGTSPFCTASPIRASFKKMTSLSARRTPGKKMDKFIAERKNESEEKRAKREAKQKKEREEERAFLRDVSNAYDFRIAGQEPVDGRPAWILEAMPRKDFHPTQPHADILPKLKGRIWIDKKEYYWVKAEAEAIDTISFGWFLARVHKGSRFSFEQTRLNDEVWLLRRFYINASARLMLFKNMGIEQEDIFSNYKKFITGTKILPGVKEVEPK